MSCGLDDVIEVGSRQGQDSPLSYPVGAAGCWEREADQRIGMCGAVLHLPRTVSCFYTLMRRAADPVKRVYGYTRLHGTTFEKTAVSVVITMKTQEFRL
jgi:hypothetical protein